MKYVLRFVQIVLFYRTDGKHVYDGGNSWQRSMSFLMLLNVKYQCFALYLLSIT